ncbi:hypothetical protein QJS10_CPA06g01267 [Acorus calamus]|uniref:peptide-methionine (S)-S-oxide reductase n=1 Tax=Acorus calamus TaxID=4465 RepID=A0AAV9ELD2_ACOCL|nr:hypothetical protein QJS10_CPA06g01267 [Acorus calamus]
MYIQVINICKMPFTWKLYPTYIENSTCFQGNDVDTQYRSSIYYYTEAQAASAQKSLEVKQKEFRDKKIMTEILPAKTFYRAEEYHQQYLEKGGRNGTKQSARMGCNGPIRCYG